MDESLALGTKVFDRTQKLEQLLDSAADRPCIQTVYVADDGDASDRESLYARDYPFELEVIDLPYDAGLGRGRNEIVDQLTEEYLLIVDPDHTVPYNVSTLCTVLKSDPDLGGVSGLLLESGDLRGRCQDLSIENNILIRDVRENHRFESADGIPFQRFDFIPNAALFRRECVQEYSWDPEYVIGFEHIDFYVGHRHRTDWQFAVCPSVLFGHHPGGSADYTSHRGNPNKVLSSKNYFLDKWGLKQTVNRDAWPVGGVINGLRDYIPTEGLSAETEGRLEDLNELIWRFTWMIRN